jgi:hypothetical protein
MKNLLDVEPRTAIRNDFISITPIVISQPGSYYLAEDIQAIHTQHGIEITASNVTLDLNGFTVYGNTEVGSLAGIFINDNRHNVTNRNGTIRDFFREGIYGVSSDGCIVEGLRVNNGLHGIAPQLLAGLLYGHQQLTADIIKRSLHQNGLCVEMVTTSVIFSGDLDRHNC